MIAFEIFVYISLFETEFMSNISKRVKTLILVVSFTLFQFLPLSSGIKWKKPLSSSFFQFLPGVLEEIGFFRKKPNPGPFRVIQGQRSWCKRKDYIHVPIYK